MQTPLCLRLWRPVGVETKSDRMTNTARASRFSVIDVE